MIEEKILELITIEHRIKSLKREIDELKMQEEELLQVVNDKMDLELTDVFEDDEIKITRVKATKTKTFDTKKFEKDYKGLFDEYVKEVDKKGYMRVTLKGE